MNWQLNINGLFHIHSLLGPYRNLYGDNSEYPSLHRGVQFPAFECRENNSVLYQYNTVTFNTIITCTQCGPKSPRHIFVCHQKHSSKCPRKLWWCHQMETFSALLALCAGNSPVTGEFPTQRPVMRSLDVFFDLRLNKRLSKQWWGWRFETPSHPSWRYSNVSTASVEPWIMPTDGALCEYCFGFVQVYVTYITWCYFIDINTVCNCPSGDEWINSLDYVVYESLERM